MYLFAREVVCVSTHTTFGRETYTERKFMKCCDNCTYYRWYFDWCTKWKCEKDYRSLCDFWKNNMEQATSGELGLTANQNVPVWVQESYSCYSANYWGFV